MSPNDPAIVTIELASGEVVEDVQVHASGGVLPKRAGRVAIERIIELARLGLPAGCYEPVAGHVQVYGHEVKRIIDLRGAKLVRCE